MPENPYAEAARLKKVIALADVIKDAGLHVLCLGDLNDADWKQIAAFSWRLWQLRRLIASPN